MIAVRIEQAEYEQFLDLLLTDAEFPRTHAEWLDKGLKDEVRHIERGHVIHGVVVRAGEFAEYCRVHARPPTVAALTAFAVRTYTEEPTQW